MPGLFDADQCGTIADFPEGDTLELDAVIEVDCEISIPAARPDAIRVANMDRLKARLVAQGGNIAIAAEAERALHERGFLAVPDFIANPGGVICAAVESFLTVHVFPKIELPVLVPRDADQ